MRKKAQDERKLKKASSIISPSSSFSNTSSFSSNSPDVDFTPIMKNIERNFYDTGGLQKKVVDHGKGKNMKVYTMDDIWKDIELSEENETKSTKQIMSSPIWDYCPNTLWMADDQEENKMFPMFYCLDNQDI